jgi:tetratricopeptide (TPR) repeat protein
MGVVFKALDPGLNRVVAIKLLTPALATSPRARGRFLREARAAAAVCHEHVVTIHAVDEAGGTPYLVMQYVAGRSLQEKIDREGPLCLKVILRVGMQVSAGLAAAHAQGLVHRDIKPANILLENDVERAKITDFGLARAATDAAITRSGTVAGIPQYMAPEQARGEPVDPRTDLFSLGGVLYAMATGKPPFDGDSAVAVLRRVSDLPHRPAAEMNPELPQWLAQIIDGLMAKEPAGRYQSAAEVADLLGHRLAEVQRLEQSGLVAVAPAPASSGGRGLPVSGKVLIAGALVLVLSGIVSVLGRARLRPSPAEARQSARPEPRPPLVAAPGKAPDWLVLGLAANQRRDHAEAARCLSEFLRRHPESTQALLARGDAYRYLGNRTAALVDHNEAIRLAPTLAAAYYARAYILVEKKDFDRALADCEEALRLDPSLTWTYYHRGLAQKGRKDFPRAIADFSTFLEHVPDFGPALFARAQCYENQGDLAGALADVDEALDLLPDNSALYHFRGWLHARRGELDPAIADYSRALRDSPNNFVRRTDRACALALAGRYEEAAVDFEAALPGAGSFPWPLVRRAQYLHCARGEFDRAIADCDRLIAIQPSFAEAYLNRGLALLGKGDASRALADLDQTLDLNQPNAPTFAGRLSHRYADLYQARGDARARLGDAAGAEADHEQAARLRAASKPAPPHK